MALDNRSYAKLSDGIEIPRSDRGICTVSENSDAANANFEALRKGYLEQFAPEE